jgi:hypothetical protein
LKAQNLLANIGGVIKGIFTIGSILCYFISSKLYNLKLINANLDFLNFNHEMSNISSCKINNEIPQTSHLASQIKLIPYSITHNRKESSVKHLETNLNFNLENFDINKRKFKIKQNLLNSKNVDRESNTIDNLQTLKLENTNCVNIKIDNPPFPNKNLDIFLTKAVSKRKNKLIFNWKDLILRLRCFKKNSQKRTLYELGDKLIKKRLCVVNILKKFNELDKLKYLLLDKDQYSIFNILPIEKLSSRKESLNENIIEENLIMDSYKRICVKADKSEIDEKILGFLI